MIETKDSFDFESVTYGSFLSEFCIVVKCQISESSDKHLRNIIQAQDPCRDWLNLAVFEGACSDPQPHSPNFLQTYGDFGTKS